MNLPPCIKKAVSARDEEALDDIFSYLKTYASDEEREAVLWSVGYYNLSNYQQKKMAARNRINVAGHFICRPDRKPPCLAKYCTAEDENACPLRNPKVRLRMLIDYVMIVPGDFPLSAHVIIALRDGSVFTIRNKTFLPTNTWPTFKNIAYRFSKWFSETHKIGDVVDFIGLTEDELAEELRAMYIDYSKKLVKEVVRYAEATSVRD